MPKGLLTFAEINKRLAHLEKKAGATSPSAELDRLQAEIRALMAVRQAKQQIERK